MLQNLHIKENINFEKFISNEEIDTPDLIKIAILHYQFESIHPFLDGNGRIGRLLIPLYIQSKGMLNKSCLYISDYIERNKDEYYDCLTRVRTQNDMIGWIKFFLTAVIETSKIAKDKFKKVVEFTMEMDRKILNMTVKPENARKVWIKKILTTRKKVEFYELFEEFSKPYIVATFLSILEMAKEQELIITQNNNFDKIYCEVS